MTAATPASQRYSQEEIPIGTNYYIRVNECTCCDRYDRLHVGKSGAMVQGYLRPLWAVSDDPEFMPTPIGEIKSFAEWKLLMRNIPHSCWDEYGRRLTDEELIEIFASTTTEHRRRQYDAIRRDHHYLIKSYWLDQDGYSVTDAEFS